MADCNNDSRPLSVMTTVLVELTAGDYSHTFATGPEGTTNILLFLEYMQLTGPRISKLVRGLGVSRFLSL